MMSLSAIQHLPSTALNTVVSAGKAIGHFLYGNETRTRYSIGFAYACIGVYMIAAMNQDLLTGCFM